MPPFPQPPRNLRAVAGDRQVQLAWGASPTTNVYYYVYQPDVSRNDRGSGCPTRCSAPR